MLASRGEISYLLFLSTVVGISFIIASGCVFNNFMDRRIDALMSRTKTRALVMGVIPIKNALVFGACLGVLGFLILFIGTNFLATLLAAAGFVFYVFVYGYFKRHSPFSTVVGSVPGAIPIVVGYCAVSNVFDIGAVLLFLAMAVWQMPHFYAISIFRHDDYKNAGLPVLSVKMGIPVTKKHVLFFVALYICLIFALGVSGTAGYVFTAVMFFLSAWWLWIGVRGLGVLDGMKWARKMFGLSLITLLIFSLMLSLDMVLH